MDYDIKKNNMKSTIIKVGITAVIVIALAVAVYLFGVRSGKAKAKASAVSVNIDNSTTVSVDVLESAIKSASDLITTRYCYKDVMTVKRGEEKSILGVSYGVEEKLVTYGGIVSIGYDIKDVKIDVNEDKKLITVELPEPKIISHEIIDKDFKEYDTENSIFVKINTEDVIQDRERAKEEQQKSLLEDPDFLNTVKLNTSTILKNFIDLATGNSGYTVTVD